MNEPKLRKIKSKTHKCFGLHSRILTQDTLDHEPWTKASGRRPGSKQLDPSNYARGETDIRTKAEKLNDAQRSHQ